MLLALKKCSMLNKQCPNGLLKSALSEQTAVPHKRLWHNRFFCLSVMINEATV